MLWAGPSSFLTAMSSFSRAKSSARADHYVLIDDKLRILAAVKEIWGPRVTTVQPLQGHYAQDEKEQSAYPPADITLQTIEEALRYDLASLTR
jgi:hypothetical protein